MLTVNIVGGGADVTVNVAEPMFPLESVSVTVCVPTAAVVGTVKKAMMLPVALVSGVGLVVITVPSKVTTYVEVMAKYPAPVTSTLAPAAPETGISVTVGTLTVTV